jgi:hypothetical protein
MASMRDGSGGEWSIVFSSAGAFLRGFDHESTMSPYMNDGALWPGLIENVPDVFAPYLTEPAFSHGSTLVATVCVWRQAGDDRWHVGDLALPPGGDPDGAGWLFEVLVDATPDAYQRLTEENYELEVDLGAVSAVFGLEPLTDEVVQLLNPDVTLGQLADDLAQIGYPNDRA